MYHAHRRGAGTDVYLINSIMSLFVKDGSITASGFLILLGIPVATFASNQWKVGVVLILLGFLTALSQSIKEIKEEDKHEIRFRNMSVADISDEIEAMDHVMAEKDRSKCLAALAVLATKQSEKDDESSQYHPHEVECICQEVAYRVLCFFPNDDEAVAAALSLNALVAKDEQVRERHLHEADVYGFNVLINAMRAALKRAKSTKDEEKERLSAELQRKACLLLGALADDDAIAATTIVDEGGLAAILDALKWYRFHEEVSNWGLWAIFVLCYEHAGNKKELIRLGGIHVVIIIMQNNPESLEVSRHGTAILFDLLREARGDKLSNVAQVRNLALAAGLHDVLVNAMNQFESSMDIVMMGQEMLVATNYQGDIPRALNQRPL
jgi:hypothetical protein